MSQTTPDNEPSTPQEAPEHGLISDEQLPEDLQPDKNPMAREPEDDDGAGSGDESRD